MSRRFVLALIILFVVILSCATAPALAQSEASPPSVQQINGRLQAGEGIHAYRLAELKAGDTLAVYAQATSGDLDPIVAVVDGTADLKAIQAQYPKELEKLLAKGGNIMPAVNALRDRFFLAWDDDGGAGYAAALEYTLPADGDYQLLVWASLSAFGRTTAGAYKLTIGVNAEDVVSGTAKPRGAAIAVRDVGALGETRRVSEQTGIVTGTQPVAALPLVDFNAGDTIQVHVAATAGDLRPAVVLRDFGGKPLAAANLDGAATTAIFSQTLAEEGSSYTVEIAGAPGTGGAATTGEFRALVGINAPDVMSGQASAAEPALKVPTPVQVGIKIDRISEVDSAGENFSVIASVRMDWRDAALAFSPDTCNCSVKLYTEKEFDRFLADANSRWPDFTFFNQVGNRWTQNRAVAVWPDGSARYIERFTTTFQADFDFTKYPFDRQEFPIMFDMILPDTEYQLVPLPNYSAISPDHGEDEFIVGQFTLEPSTLPYGAGAERQVARMSFTFSGPRHLEYYILQVFVPILLIILISWFTFFLKDYTRRIEASAANVLLFIAFSFSLASNYPRLGYITFLDAIMTVTFIVNTLVLLYNVQMKRWEGQGKSERVDRIDRFFDWAYPLMYVLLIGLVAFWFLGPFQTG